MIKKNDKIFIAGHNGMIGSAILKKFKKNGYKNILTVDKKELDLRNQNDVFNFFKRKKPKATIIAAAKVGGIYANDRYKADFIFDNLSIQNNLIHGSFKSKIKNLIFLGSSCIYPKNSPQPIKESYLLNGPLEHTNESYAIAKIAGLKMCESYNIQHGTNYKCLMPANSYGPGDNYNTYGSHFFPANIKKLFFLGQNKKKKALIWGTGKVKRELIFSEDVADACLFFLNKKIREPILNIGTGRDMTIKQYIQFIAKKLNLDLEIRFDHSKPDGMPRKVLDVSLAKKYGWIAKTSLSDGFDKTFEDFQKNINKLRS
tara:strand:- start:69 stop:1013 length:945 start_codon:yes stop_codon:yes gene_type:complete